MCIRDSRWAAEGPSILQLTRSGRDNILKIGDVVEICGYVPKEPVTWQIASADTKSRGLGGKLMNAETLVRADGRQVSWGVYGVHKCFESGYSDQHSK